MYTPSVPGMGPPHSIHPSQPPQFRPIVGMTHAAPPPTQELTRVDQLPILKLSTLDVNKYVLFCWTSYHSFLPIKFIDLYLEPSIFSMARLDSNVVSVGSGSQRLTLESLKWRSTWTGTLERTEGQRTRPREWSLESGTWMLTHGLPRMKSLNKQVF